MDILKIVKSNVLNAKVIAFDVRIVLNVANVMENITSMLINNAQKSALEGFTRITRFLIIINVKNATRIVPIVQALLVKNVPLVKI